VLVVAGGNGREWLADRCIERGARVHHCTAYARQAPAPTPPWCEALAQAQRQGQLWIFSSAEALANLKACTAGHDWSGTTALTTHPRIAQTAQAMGCGQVWVCRSSLDDVIETLESKQHDR
jgi:uroporphyrinogen-III synthase